MSLVLLNLAGGDCVEDLRVLEGDEGFARVASGGSSCMGGRAKSVGLWSGAGDKSGGGQCPRLRRCFAIFRRFMMARKRPSA